MSHMMRCGEPIPINSEGQFCQTCHVETAVNIDCFSCHASVPRGRKPEAYISHNHNHLEDQVSQEIEELVSYFEGVK